MNRKIALCLAGAALACAALAPMPARGAAAMLQATPPTLTAADLFGGTPEAFQYRVLRSYRKVAALEIPQQRIRFGVGYEDLSFGAFDGNAWTFDLGYERTMSPWGWGVLVPSQLWDLSGLEDLLQLGFAPYAFTYVNETIRVGGFVEIDFTNSDIAGIGDDTSYGLGGSASALFKPADIVTIAPVGLVEYYRTGQDSQEDSAIVQAGVQVAVTPGEHFDFDLYGYFTYDAQNDDLDGTFWEFGASLTFTITEGWGVTVGYEAVTGADEFDADRFFVDAQYDF
ncbi:MAG: hypothetical protein JW889_07100 [Verrucomicrobia bacterium]|nr:hypothetical protein [Verrucomicrobiota bacterium]